MRYAFAQDFRHDLIAGISVAAVALPVGVAYAQLAGFDPVIGLYSCILPLVAYAVFGTSRQLIVNPDAATCAMIAAAIAPLAAGDRELYLSLAIALTFFTGLFCIAGSFFRLGALADFLSRPILVGFMNGIAISIFLGQVSKLLGFPRPAASFRGCSKLFQSCRARIWRPLRSGWRASSCCSPCAASSRVCPQHWLPSSSQPSSSDC
jgi:MFS superfamily sulfate permease-like transporter